MTIKSKVMVIKFTEGKNMNIKYTSYVSLGILAMSLLLLSASPTMANPSTNGKVVINSQPQGAAVYEAYGVNDGRYLGTTPFSYDPSGGNIFIKFIKPGYLTATTPMYWWYPQYTDEILAILSPG